MLANKMMGDSGETKDSTQDLSSEPHVVVACPSCRTKFAVESSLVASYETPKFHCSRCDSVFELTQRNNHHRSARQAQAQDSKRWILADNSDANTPNPFAQPEPRATTPSIVQASDFTLGSPSEQPTLEPRKPFAPLEERTSVSLLGLRPSAGATIASTTITRQQALSHITETSPPAINKEDDPFALFDPPSTFVTQQPAKTAPPIEPTTPPATPLIEPVSVTPPPREPLLKQPAEQTRQQPLSTQAPVAQTATIEIEEDRPSRASQLRAFTSHSLARLSERNQHLVRMSLPVLSTVLAVCILGYTSRLLPGTFDSIFSTAIPSIITGKIAHTPDPSLHVQSVTLDFEKTQSKETIPVVRGVINNATGHSVEEVLIEALGFNIRGEVVVRAKAPLRSALAREKISDLPLDTVRKFQTSLSARNSSINNGEKVGFTVALLSDYGAPQDITYFSARVYSVGDTRP